MEGPVEDSVAVDEKKFFHKDFLSILDCIIKIEKAGNASI
jgi:hypothetical protein